MFIFINCFVLNYLYGSLSLYPFVKYIEYLHEKYFKVPNLVTITFFFFEYNSYILKQKLANVKSEKKFQCIYIIVQLKSGLRALSNKLVINCETEDVGQDFLLPTKTVKP